MEHNRRVLREVKLQCQKYIHLQTDEFLCLLILVPYAVLTKCFMLRPLGLHSTNELETLDMRTQTSLLKRNRRVAIEQMLLKQDLADL